MAVSPGGRPMDTSPFSTSTDDNWVSRAGGLPKYVRGVAHALLRTGRARDESQAIKLAVGVIRDWAEGRTSNGKGHVHPQVQAAAAAALAEWEAKRASSHAHSNDQEAVELAGAFNAAAHPRAAAGNTGGGQFVSGSDGSTTKTSTSTIHSKQTGRYYTQSQWSSLHQEHMDHLQHLVDTGKATKAQKAELTGLKAQKAAAVKAAAKAKAATAAKKTTATAKTATKAKTVAAPKKAAPKVDKAKGTVTATVGGKKVTMTLHQWHALHVAHEKAAATRLAGDSPAVNLAATPAPETAAGRRTLASKGQALTDGTAPIPDVAYLKKAIRSAGRVDPAKRPALKALIRKRARELKAVNEPGVKGTWAFEGASDTDAVELAMMTRTARVRGPGDVSCKRTAPGEVTVTHKATGMRVGKLTQTRSGWQGTHATGKATPASGSMAGALSGLIGAHNKIAASMPDAMPMPEVQAYAQHLAAMELSGSLPFTSAATSSDGPRMTVMDGAKTAKAPSGMPAGLSAEAQEVYRKLIARGLKPAQALAMAKRAATMHAKAVAA